MAQDGLFPKAAGQLNKAHVPGWSLIIQGIWAALLILPRTYNTATHSYGSLYSNLLDYIISAALIFYILTIAGVLRLRSTRPDAIRPYRAWDFLLCRWFISWAVQLFFIAYSLTALPPPGRAF